MTPRLVGNVLRLITRGKQCSEDCSDLLYTVGTFQAALNKAGKIVPTGVALNDDST